MIFLKLIRAKNIFIIILLQLLLRYTLIIPILNHFDVKPVLPEIYFILVILATSLFAASGYIINDYFDLRIDRINKPDKVLIGKKIKRRTALFLHVLLTVTAVFIGFFLAFVSRKENYALIAVITPIVLWYYSTNFKKHAVIGNLIISLFTALVAYAVVSIEFASLAKFHGTQILSTEACSTAWFWTTGFAFFAFITNFSREIIKDTEDVKGDEATGCKTLPIIMGVKLTKAFLLILEIATIIALWLIYFHIDLIQSIPYSLIYFSVGLTVPHFVLIAILYKAKSPKEFHTASTINKIIMVLGILFIALAGKAF